MTPETILKALEHDLQEKGYPAIYVGRSKVLPELHNLEVHGTPNSLTKPFDPLKIGSWEGENPHILVMATPDWKVDLADPNSIDKLYTEIHRRVGMTHERLQRLPIMQAIAQEFRERAYITSHDTTDTGERVTLTNPALTRTIFIHTRKEAPHIIRLTNPTQDIDLADPNSIDALQQAIRDRFQDAL